MQKYEYLIFDADHTLLHYKKDEKAAFCRMFQDYGLPTTDETLDEAVFLSQKVWDEAGMNDVHSPSVQATWHTVYRTHVLGIFRILFEKYPCNVPIEKAGARFLKELQVGLYYMPSALEILSHFSKKTGGRYEIVVATNGVCDIQKSRLAPLEKYIKKAYISEEMGAIKPTFAYFDYILKDLGTSADKCLMIGDSLHSDMAGAKGSGMDCCWYNPYRQNNDTGIKIDKEISSLEELKNFL